MAAEYNKYFMRSRAGVYAQGLTREPWKPELAYSSLMLYDRGRGKDRLKSSQILYLFMSGQAGTPYELTQFSPSSCLWIPFISYAVSFLSKSDMV